MEVAVRTGLLELQVVQSFSQIITTNKPTSSFLQAGCPSCRATNSVKALKENTCKTLVNTYQADSKHHIYQLLSRQHGGQYILTL